MLRIRVIHPETYEHWDYLIFKSHLARQFLGIKRYKLVLSGNNYKSEKNILNLVVLLKVESIRMYPKSKKIMHFTESGVKEIKTQNKGDDAIPEGLAYINRYMSENGFKLVNVTTMEAGSVSYIVYDIYQA